jgi:hypothetical protein
MLFSLSSRLSFLFLFPAANFFSSLHPLLIYKIGATYFMGHAPEDDDDDAVAALIVDVLPALLYCSRIIV